MKPTTTIKITTEYITETKYETTTETRIPFKDKKKMGVTDGSKKYTTDVRVLDKIDLSGLKNTYVLQACTIVIVVIGLILFIWLAFFHRKPKPDVPYTNDASMAHIGLQEDDEKLI